MRVVALVSGGKDSCYNMLQCIAAGHDIVAIAHLKPCPSRAFPTCNAGSPTTNANIELDSFMYQSVGHEAVDLYASALELPLYQRPFDRNTALCADADYVPTDGDEVEALYALLVDVKAKEEVNAVSVGAILSNYQRVRVENVCSRLGLTVLAYMWRRDQEELLAEMIAVNLRAVVIKVATLGLTPAEHLGKEISEIYPHLVRMNERYGLNVCGEGGEYETFTLDCPLFKKSIVIDEQVVIEHDSNEISPVAYLKLVKCSLKPKPSRRDCTQREVLTEMGIRGPLNYLNDLDVDLSVVNGSPLRPTMRDIEVPNWRQASSAVPTVTHLRNGWVSIGGIVATADDSGIAATTSNALRFLTKVLASEHMSAVHLVAVQLFVANMDDFGAINGAYKEFFDINPPSRVCVQVPLPKDVILVMDCVAYKGEQTVKHMHVQGVSHWAPANIGPYSQAVQVADAVTHVAGQIALVPGTMQLIADITAQCRLSLRHVRRVLDAIQPTGSCTEILSCVCYVTHSAHADTARDAILHWRSSVDGGRSCLAAVQDDDVVYVVVSGLPRGASVEWHVVAANFDGISPRRVRLTDTIVGDGCVTITSSVATCGLTVLQAQCSSSSELAETTLTDVFKQIDGLVKSIRNDILVSHDDENYGHLAAPAAEAHYQVFFNVDKVTYDQLYTAWKNAIGDCGLTLIPVVTANPTDDRAFMTLLVRI